MSEENETEETNHTPQQRTALDYLYQAFVSATKFFTLSVDWTWHWFERRHALIQAILLLPITVAVGPLVMEAISSSFNFFFGQLIPIGNDVQTRTHPLPLGFSLNIIYLLWFLTATVGFVQVKSLQTRIEQLEDS